MTATTTNNNYSSFLGVARWDMPLAPQRAASGSGSVVTELLRSLLGDCRSQAIGVRSRLNDLGVESDTIELRSQAGALGQQDPHGYNYRSKCLRIISHPGGNQGHSEPVGRGG